MVNQEKDVEAFAKTFHNAYERLGTEQRFMRPDRPLLLWDDLPDNYKNLIIAACREAFGQRDNA